MTSRLCRYVILLIVAAINIVLFQNCAKFSLDEATTQKALQAPFKENSFQAVQKVLKTNCNACHREGGSASFARLDYANEEDFVASGMVTPGDPGRSKLIFRLKRYPKGGAGARNMPIGGNLVDRDYSTLFLWVANLNLNIGPYACNSDSANEAVVSSHAKRLSQKQYEATLNDLLLRFFSAGEVRSLLGPIFSSVNFPIETGERYKRWDNNFDLQHARTYFDVADAISLKLIEDAYYTKFVTGVIGLNKGGCLTLDVDHLSLVCQRQFIQNLGLRVYRRPLVEKTDENEVDLLSEFDTPVGKEGVSGIVLRLLMSPSFLFQMEDQEQPAQDRQNTLELSSYAIINRLSYTFWNTMPDETLFTMAATKDLQAEANFELALDHVFSNEQKLSSSVREFFHDWLKLDKTPHFKVGTEASKLMAKGLVFDEQMRTDMINEVEELGEYVTRMDLGFSDLFTTDISFARSPELMKLYGTDTAAPFPVTPVGAVKIQRHGILTRAALLASESGAQNPVLRGIRIRHDFLCQSTSPPPADSPDALSPPVFDPNKTVRERYHDKTSPALCMECHRSINPLGFAFSNYNGFGFYQTEEPTFLADGSFNNRYLPVDSKVDLSDVFGPGASADGARQLSQMVAERAEAKKCFTEEFARYVLLRKPQLEVEGCRLNRMYRYLEGSSSLKDFMRSFARDPQFRLRGTAAEGVAP